MSFSHYTCLMKSYRRLFTYLVSLPERSLGDLITRMLEEVDSSVDMRRINSLKLHFAQHDAGRAVKRERSTMVTMGKATVQLLQVIGAQVGSTGANPRKHVEHTVIWSGEFSLELCLF